MSLAKENAEGEIRGWLGTREFKLGNPDTHKSPKQTFSPSFSNLQTRIC